MIDQPQRGRGKIEGDACQHGVPYDWLTPWFHNEQGHLTRKRLVACPDCLAELEKRA